MKPCNRCDSWKPATAYYPDSRGRSRDGRMHTCKDCERASAAARARARYVRSHNPMSQLRDSFGRFAT